MATRKPLVIVNGLVEQLQAGDTLGISSETGDLVMTNGNGSTVPPGSPVYVQSNDTFDLAQANASGTAYVIGLTVISIGSAGTGVVRMNGVLDLTTGQWDAVAGTTGGLTAGTTYWLDPSTPGMLTSTAPTTVGQYVVKVGRAISTTEMMISIEEPILL